MKRVKWYDVRDTIERWRVFNFFLGGRGIGKTYSVLSYAFLSELSFLYVRSTETQIKTCLSPDRGNPFKKWASDHKRNIYIKSGEDINDIVEVSGSEKEGNESFRSWGYAVSLSTFENLRGADFQHIDLIIYDEFIQTKTLAYDAWRAFLNMYESVNRNREIEGREAVRVLFLANTQELANPILSGFDLVNNIEKLKLTGQKKFSRGDIYVELCESAVSKMKEKSVLYRNLKEDDAYLDEAIRNNFSRNDFSGIQKPKNLREWKPLCMVDDVTIWKHKSRHEFYCSKSYCNKVNRFNSNNQRGLFFRSYGGQLQLAYGFGTLYCDSFLTRSFIIDVLNLS